MVADDEACPEAPIIFRKSRGSRWSLSHPANKRTPELLLKEEQRRLKEAETRLEKSRCLLAAYEIRQTGSKGAPALGGQGVRWHAMIGYILFRTMWSLACLLPGPERRHGDAREIRCCRHHDGCGPVLCVVAEARGVG